MLAYHSDPKIKKTYLARVEAHRKADEIVQNYGYWTDGKGCAVGCTLHGSLHADYETELGIPASIAHLEDCIFERLPTKVARAWPSRFLRAIKSGSDLSLVTARFMVWLLVDETDGVVRHCKGFADAELSVKNVAALYQRIIEGGSVSDSEWSQAAARAAAGAWSAAGAAAFTGKMADKLIELLKAA